MLRPVKRPRLALTLLCLLLVACGDDAAARQRRAEARVLQRQVETLREIRDAARERRLVDPGWVAVAVDERAVQSIIQAGLPLETVVASRFRVKVDAAEVSFRSGTGLVRFKGEVVDTEGGLSARVVSHGGHDDIVVGGDGRLRTRALIDNVEVPTAQAQGSDAPALAQVAEALAGGNLQELQDRVPALAIPVRMQQSVAVPGLREGPVRIEGGELPFQATVRRVLPLSGRLWVFLEVRSGPARRWTRRARGRTP